MKVLDHGNIFSKTRANGNRDENGATAAAMNLGQTTLEQRLACKGGKGTSPPWTCPCADSRAAFFRF